MTKSEAWKRHIEDQRGSGESMASYCRRHSLSKSSFEYWQRKLRGEGRFVAVAPVIEHTITVELPGKALIRLSDVSQLSKVLEVLDARA